MNPNENTENLEKDMFRYFNNISIENNSKENQETSYTKICYDNIQLRKNIQKLENKNRLLTQVNSMYAIINKQILCKYKRNYRQIMLNNDVYIKSLEIYQQHLRKLTSKINRNIMQDEDNASLKTSRDHDSSSQTVETMDRITRQMVEFQEKISQIYMELQEYVYMHTNDSYARYMEQLAEIENDDMLCNIPKVTVEVDDGKSKDIKCLSDMQMELNSMNERNKVNVATTSLKEIVNNEEVKNEEEEYESDYEVESDVECSIQRVAILDSMVADIDLDKSKDIASVDEVIPPKRKSPKGWSLSFNITSYLDELSSYKEYAMYSKKQIEIYEERIQIIKQE